MQPSTYLYYIPEPKTVLDPLESTLKVGGVLGANKAEYLSGLVVSGSAFSIRYVSPVVATSSFDKTLDIAVRPG